MSLFTRSGIILTFLVGLTAQANGDSCDLLLEKLAHLGRSFDTTKSIYLCGPETLPLGGSEANAVDGCLVSLETPYDSSIHAYYDAANDHFVDWIVEGSGSRSSGRHICATIETYARIEGTGDHIELTLSRETARDILFCPFGKLFTSYKTSCTRVP